MTSMGKIDISDRCVKTMALHGKILALETEVKGMDVAVGQYGEDAYRYIANEIRGLSNDLLSLVDDTIKPIKKPIKKPVTYNYEYIGADYSIMIDVYRSCIMVREELGIGYDIGNALNSNGLIADYCTADGILKMSSLSEGDCFCWVYQLTNVRRI